MQTYAGSGAVRTRREYGARPYVRALPTRLCTICSSRRGSATTIRVSSTSTVTDSRSSLSDRRISAGATSLVSIRRLPSRASASVSRSPATASRRPAWWAMASSRRRRSASSIWSPPSTMASTRPAMTAAGARSSCAVVADALVQAVRRLVHQADVEEQGLPGTAQHGADPEVELVHLDGLAAVAAVHRQQAGQGRGGGVERGSGPAGASEQLDGGFVGADHAVHRLVGDLEDAERREARRLRRGRGRRVLDPLRWFVGDDGQGARGMGDVVGGHITDVVEDGAERNALLEVAIGSGGHRPPRHLRRTEPGQHDDLRVGAQLAEAWAAPRDRPSPAWRGRAGSRRAGGRGRPRSPRRRRPPRRRRRSRRSRGPSAAGRGGPGCRRR